MIVELKMEKSGRRFWVYLGPAAPGREPTQAEVASAVDAAVLATSLLAQIKGEPLEVEDLKDIVPAVVELVLRWHGIESSAFIDGEEPSLCEHEATA